MKKYIKNRSIDHPSPSSKPRKWKDIGLGERSCVKACHQFVWTLLLAALVSCSTIYGVDYDYGNDFNFEQIESYSINQVNVEVKQGAVIVEHIQKTVDQVLGRKGYKQSSSQPDVTITSAVETWQRPTEPPDPYMAAYGYYTAPPIQHFEDMRVVLNFYLPDTTESIGQGSVNIDISDQTQEQIEQAIYTAIEIILKKFPNRLNGNSEPGKAKE